MAEFSFPWTMAGGGDDGPYSADDYAYWQEILNQISYAATESVVRDFWAELDLTVPAANTVRLDIGAAVVKGRYYRNTATIDFNIPTPIAATRVDRVVLRSTWGATQTVRAGIVTGIEGAGLPALTQNDGVLWEVPLWQVSITVAGPGTITLTDDRVPLREYEVRFLVQAVAARNITDGTDITRTSAVGWTFPNSKHCAAWGQFYMPLDLTYPAPRYMTIIPVVYPAATGNVYNFTQVDYGQVLQAYNVHSIGGVYAANAVIANTIRNLAGTAMAARQPESDDTLTLTWDRDAVNVLDTCEDAVDFMGWLLVYRAAHKAA